MLLGHKLVNAAQTKIILSNIGFNKSGITPERILNYFNFKMFLSTWVLSDATQRVCVVPLADKRGLRQKLRDPKSQNPCQPWLHPPPQGSPAAHFVTDGSCP